MGHGFKLPSQSRSTEYSACESGAPHGDSKQFLHSGRKSPTVSTRVYHTAWGTLKLTPCQSGTLISLPRMPPPSTASRMYKYLDHTPCADTQTNMPLHHRPWKYVYACVCVYIYICVCVCLYTHTHIYIYVLIALAPDFLTSQAKAFCDASWATGYQKANAAKPRSGATGSFLGGGATSFGHVSIFPLITHT